MKKYAFLFLVCFWALGVQAQDQVTPQYEYCQIIGVSKLLSTKIAVSIDFGQERNILLRYDVVDSDGKQIVFNSIIDAMNYLSTFGWRFVQAYTVPTNNQCSYYYVMERPVPEVEEEYSVKLRN